MSKYSAKGTLLQRSIASVFTTVSQIRSLRLPAGDVQFWDGSALDSGVSLEDGELTGHAAPGECSFSGWYDPADSVHELLPADIAGGGSHESWQVLLPDTGASVATFTGSTKTFELGAESGGGLGFDSTIKLRSLAAFPSSA